MYQKFKSLNRSRFMLVFIFLFILVAIPFPSFSNVVAQGVEYKNERWNNCDVHILIVDLTKATVEAVIPPRGSYGLYTVAQITSDINSRQSASHNTRIVAGVNGGFFECLRNCDCSLPMCIKNLSKIVTRRNYHDVQLNQNDSRWSYVSMRSELRLYSGGTVEVARPQDMPRPVDYDVLGGAGYLLPRSSLMQSIRDENPPMPYVRRARTAVGYSSNRELWIVTVSEDGASPGMTLIELSDYLARKGLVRALALDGGGSSQMWVKGITPSTSGVVLSGRAILSALVVWAEPTLPPPPVILPPIQPRGSRNEPGRFPTVPNLDVWCLWGRTVAHHLSRGETSQAHWNRIIRHVMSWENNRSPGALRAFRTGLYGGDCSVY